MSDRILEKINTFLEATRIDELKPVVKEEGNPLRFVFKLPESGKVTCEFMDGSSAEVNVDPDDKCSGKYAMIAKGSGKPMECWDKKPSRKAVAQRLRELKFFG